MEKGSFNINLSLFVITTVIVFKNTKGFIRPLQNPLMILRCTVNVGCCLFLCFLH